MKRFFVFGYLGAGVSYWSYAILDRKTGQIARIGLWHVACYVSVQMDRKLKREGKYDNKNDRWKWIPIENWLYYGHVSNADQIFFRGLNLQDVSSSDNKADNDFGGF